MRPHDNYLTVLHYCVSVTSPTGITGYTGILSQNDGSYLIMYILIKSYVESFIVQVFGHATIKERPKINYRHHKADMG